MADVSTTLLDAREVEDALQHSFSAFQNTVSRLVGRGRLEGALAALNDDSYARITHEVQQRFPSTAEQFIGSTHSTLLSSFAAHLPDAIPASKGELVRRLDGCWKAVVLARPALSEIAMMFTANTSSRANVHAKPFSDLGLEVPNTIRELASLEGEILRDQEGVLQYFLEVLRGPARLDVLARQRELRELEAAAVHPPRNSATDNGARAAIAPNAETPTETSQAVSEAGAAPKVVNIPKAALYVEGVKGFGEWEVFVTDHAKKDLRKLRKDSKDVFLMVMKKMRDLSNGHFSSDNQVPVADTEKGIPIFKARICGAHRLVYQVDSVNDTTSSDAHQALRIFGVYDHAEVHRMRSFWEAVSRDLGRQGKTYRDQCRARSQPRRSANDVFDPVKFYHPENSDDEESEELDEPDTSGSDLSDKDYETILSMHRQVMFSKALYNSFLIGHDLEFMYRPSATETEIIEHPSSCYIIGRSGTGKTLTMMYKIISVERGWWTASWDLPRPRQMFVTRSPMLSRRVQRTVSEILESFRLADVTQQELVDIWKRRAGPVEHSRPLPRKWSELEDDHFPLIISFDKLRELLEADFTAAGRLRIRTAEEDDDEGFDETSFISAKRFIATYWDHLPKSVVKGLDPASVFGEIMGVIKGSEGTVNTSRGYLDYKAYLDLGERSHPTFATMRDKVYNIFNRYLKLKRGRYERDDADRTHELLSLLKTHGLPGRPVEFLFNDEAQDNLIIDMLLLRSLCNNPNGLCWAGDTAQTIALGSSFKFSELTSTMYRVEESNSNTRQRDSYAPPRMFYLTVNYRSHAGIINCAQTVVDLLTMWPESIDRLDPDPGWRKGPKPKIVRRSGFQELFRFVSKDSINVKSEFSSEQCIIVRDDASRKALFSHGTPGGQVMTVYQSKGLEFNDVFLWHFFESSEPSKWDWECVCDVLRGNPMQSYHKAPEQYRNLKALYVAMTRARNRLWIIEASDSDKADPMLALWTEQEKMEVTEDSVPVDVPEEPDTEGWEEQGRVQMDKQNFEQAEYAFGRAGRERERKIAQAYLSREVAVTEEDFRKVASSFQRCAKLSEGMPDHHELVVAAAACYSRARAFPDSARLYYSVCEYTKCTRQYIRGSMMEDARQVILEHMHDIDEFVVKKVCVYFLDQSNYRPVEQLFNDQEDLVQFMKRHDLPHLADYLEHLSRFREAAEVHIGHHRIPKAIELFFRGDEATLVSRGTSTLLGELRHRYTIGRPVEGSKDVKKLNALLSSRKALLERYPILQSEESQIHVFSLITSRRWKALLELGRQLGSDSLALLSLDYAFTLMLEEGPRTFETVKGMVVDFTVFPIFQDYAALLKSHCDEPRASQVLGIVKGKYGFYILLEGTLLYESAQAQKGLDVHTTIGEGGLTISRSSLARHLRDTLEDHLHTQFSVVSNACRTIRIMRPCMSYCLSGHCVNVDKACQWIHWGGPHPLDKQGILLRLRVLCEVIVTCGMIDATSQTDSVWKTRTYWMSSLSNCLLVPFFALGTPLMCPSLELVSKFSEASRVVNTWITDIMYFPSTPDSSRRPPSSSAEVRSQAIPCAALLGYMLDNLRDCPHAASIVTPPLELWYWYGPSYKQHTRQLHKYAQVVEMKHAQMPGALLYLRFLLRIDGNSQGRGPIITHIAEGLATAFVLTKPIPNHRTLHNVILGRRWLRTLFDPDMWDSATEALPPHDHRHIDEFVKLLRPVLRMLCTLRTGPALFLLPSNLLLSQSVSRVINAWFLVAHGLKLSEASRPSIINDIKGIPPHRRPLHLYPFYENSSWDNLEQAVWGSNGPGTILTPADQLVHVQNEDTIEEEPMDTPWTVDRVAYKGMDSLLSLLCVQTAPSEWTHTPFPREWRLPKPNPASVKNNDWARPKPMSCFLGQLPVA